MNIRDVRALMPNYPSYADQHRTHPILGIAIHHSATANPTVGVPSGDALSLFQYHVLDLGWLHGAYHYVIHANGLIEYALDEQIEGFHAGFHDPDDEFGLQQGQHWNQHFLAICLLGWFESERTLDRDGVTIHIPDYFTKPTAQQMQAVVGLLRHLQAKYNIPSDQVMGHRELTGCKTRCPGVHVDLDALRASLETEA